MSTFFELLEQQRGVLLKKTEHLTTDQYNLVPPGFNNNIIWNMGHVLTITDSLLYSNTPFEIPQHKFEVGGFKKGTKPDRSFADTTISEIRQSMSGTVSLLRKSLNNTAITGSKMTEHDLLQLIGNKYLQFILFHEEMHLGTVQRLLKYV